MQSLILNHPWIDETFYRQGSFLVLDQGKSVLLLKGGVCEKNFHASIEGTATIFCKNFFSDEFLFQHSDQFLKLTLDELRTFVISTSENITIESVRNDDHVFAQDFSELKGKIPVNVKKVVLVSRENYRTNNPSQLIRHLVAKAIMMPYGNAYGFWNKDHGIVGCTPEVLFEMDQGVIVTEALAGTAKKGEESELLLSIKDRNEHEYVIQDLREKLISLGFEIKIGQTETKQFSSIIHLRTRIEAVSSRGVSALTLTKNLSPTAALGGYPKHAAKEFLLSTRYNDLYPNRLFGSVIGTEFNGPAGYVMIRNLQWEGENFFIESGAGVVEDSILEKELLEINLKRQVVRNHYL